MARTLQLVNGRMRGVEDAASPTIYRPAKITIVTGSPGANELQTNGNDADSNPIFVSGTAITLPDSGTYTGDELLVEINNMPIDSDKYNSVGGSPFSQLSFTFDLYPDDKIEFKKFRNE